MHSEGDPPEILLRLKHLLPQGHYRPSMFFEVSLLPGEVQQRVSGGQSVAKLLNRKRLQRYRSAAPTGRPLRDPVGAIGYWTSALRA